MVWSWSVAQLLWSVVRGWYSAMPNGHPAELASGLWASCLTGGTVSMILIGESVTKKQLLFGQVLTLAHIIITDNDVTWNMVDFVIQCLVDRTVLNAKEKPARAYPFYLSGWFYLSTCLSIDLPMHLSICRWAIYFLVYLFVYLSIYHHLSSSIIHLSTYLPI